jgi:hypothetical protein
VLNLPSRNGGVEKFSLRGRPVTAPLAPAFDRDAFAAAHVVRDPLSSLPGNIDWEATLAFRRHLLSCGFGIAEAMDTAQRGMGLSPGQAMELISHTVADTEERARDRIYGGVGTDSLPDDAPAALGAVVGAYEAQLAEVQRSGAGVILMASRALARAAQSPEDYLRAYRLVLAQADRPVILHWLGEMFDPALEGYWGAADFDAAAETVLAIIEENRLKVRGIKLSLLDADKEIALRRRLPAGIRMYTGDDFNYPKLIGGDETGHSDALLGIFDPIASIASAALNALAQGDRNAYHALLDPTLPLARHIFAEPTWRYKTGVVFLAWLNGFQPHFRMIAGAEAARSLPHLAELFRLADGCGALADPEEAERRFAHYLETQGVAQTAHVMKLAG